MKRRQFLTGAAGAALISTLPTGAIRAWAQSASGVITFGQSTAVLTLDPAHGRSYEAGVKSEWLDKRLYLTGAVFRAQQDGLAAFAGSFPDGKSYYAGVDTTVTGYELEATGALADGWSVNAGWTQLKIEDGGGAPTRRFLPRKTLKLATTYTVPRWRNLTLGAAVRWQSAVSVEDIAPIRQGAYGVVDVMAAVDVAPRVRATLNVKNAGDERYLTSLMWNQSYYAAPRSASLRLDYVF